MTDDAGDHRSATRTLRWLAPDRRGRVVGRESALTMLELAIVVACAIAFSAAFYDPSPDVMPRGGEYSPAIQPYYFWQRLISCGACALWNGAIRGGVPALIDVHAGLLHPLPAIGVLIAGMPNGIELALIGAFVLAGLAQWWLGQALGLGRVARTWAAVMAVVAGNLASRMEGGWVNLVIAGAACALVYAPLVGLMRTGSQRMVVLLALALAGAAVSGQGYTQLGILLVLPLALVIPAEGLRWRALARLLAAVAIAALVAGPFLVPLAALLREVGKDVDVTFRTAQAFRYVPLNFVVNDIDFYRTELLEKQAYPGLYVNFVGWLPVLLAMLGLGAVASEERRIGERRAVLFLSLCVVLLVWVSSATPLRALVQLSPWQSLDELIGAWRNPSPIAGLAVAPLLALAAIGVQRLLDAPWPPLALALGAAPHRTWRIELETRWLLAIGLVAAVAQAASFSHQWVAKSTIEPMVHQQLDGLRTPGLEWVRPPFGEGVFVEPAVRQGLKVVDDMRPWYWRDHDAPQPLVLASRTEESDPELRVVSEIDGVRIYEGPPERSYATLAQADGLVVCTARGVGGDVDVTCPPHNGGLLTVKEHYTAGWHASAGGVPLALRPALWLTMELPAGQTAVQLRYRPWTRWLGVILCVLGLALAAGVWWCAGAQETAASAD